MSAAPRNDCGVIVWRYSTPERRASGRHDWTSAYELKGNYNISLRCAACIQYSGVHWYRVTVCTNIYLGILYPCSFVAGVRNIIICGFCRWSGEFAGNHFPVKLQTFWGPAGSIIMRYIWKHLLRPQRAIRQYISLLSLMMCIRTTA